MPNELRPSKIEITQGSREGGVVRETLAFLYRPFYAWHWRLRTRWLLRRGAIHAHRWRNPPWNKVLVVVMWVLTLLLVAWVVRAVVTLLWFREHGWAWGPYNPDAACTNIVTSCDAVNGIVMPVLLLAYSTVAFLAWRLVRVRRYYARQAREHPEQLVQSAGSLMDQVVGRDQVCDAIMNNLHDRRVRRPHVIIGNVGAGKTALMVHLTRRLAARGAIPVPIRLRDVQQEEDLDFSELARKRFGEIVAPVVTSGAELDRVWRWLRRSADRVVVVADGLDEALAGPEVAGLRDNAIRTAITQVGAAKVALPLVIASRPHDPLRGMQAAISDLEPLSDEAALRYVASAGTWRADLKPIDRLVEAAHMAESPLYLQIAKDLHARDLLEPVWSDDGSGQVETQDRWALRESLLYAWFDALIDGAIHPELPIDCDTRNAVVEFVSALACIGLAADTARVSLGALDPNLVPASGQGPGHACGTADAWVERTARRLGERMKRLQHPDGCPQDPDAHVRTPWMDVRMAATWAARMGLVHESGHEVHFQHSIIQAYLGSRFLDAQLEDVALAASRAQRVEVPAAAARRPVAAAAGPVGGSPAAAPQPPPHRAPDAPAPPHKAVTIPAATLTASSEHIAHAIRHGGRELLIALTLHSRSVYSTCTCRDGESETAQACAIALTVEHMRARAGELLERAEQAEQRVYRTLDRPGGGTAWDTGDNRGDPRRRALELYGAAVDVSTADAHPRIDELMAELHEKWGQFGIGQDPARLSEAKRNLVKQCGAAIRHVPQREAQKKAYDSLYRIAIVEPDARVRSAITQEIGTGAEIAFEALADTFHGDVRSAGHEKDAPGPSGNGDTPAPPPLADTDTDTDTDGLNGHGADLSAREQRAWRLHDLRLRQRRERKIAEDETLAERRTWQKKVLDAWTLPLLVESAARAYHAGSPQRELERLVAEIAQRCRRDSLRVVPGGLDGSAPPASSSPGTAAQITANGADGFAPDGVDGTAKFDPGSGEALSASLARGLKYAANRRSGPGSNKEGREFLKKQTGELLKHSTFWLTRLTLVQALALWALPDDVNSPQPMRGHGADPGGQVREWLARPDGERDHPLVEAAGRLAVRALQTRRPERFMWIDEASVASAIGTEVSSPGEQRAHNLWIPPSTGWSSLDPLAQQLLADVLVLIVLGERGHRPKELFRVIDRLRDERRLPSCLSRDRSRLDPVRAVESDAQPGDHCPCGMRMCPYPAKAEKDLRVEFTEVFCLRQRDLLKAWQPRSWLYLRLRREARWQRGVPVAGMRRFWDEMGERARDVNPQETRTARRLIRS